MLTIPATKSSQTAQPASTSFSVNNKVVTSKQDTTGAEKVITKEIVVKQKPAISQRPPQVTSNIISRHDYEVGESSGTTSATSKVSESEDQFDSFESSSGEEQPPPRKIVERRKSKRTASQDASKNITLMTKGKGRSSR